MKTQTLPLSEFYLELDWPSIPDEICTQCREYIKEAENVWIPTTRGPSALMFFKQYAAPDFLLEWIYNNILVDLEGFTVRLQYAPREIVPAHIDLKRSSNHLYVIDSDDGTTSWLNDAGDIIKSVSYKERVWYAHQSKVLHQVTGMTAGRLGISIFKEN
jgi:hypothetical protein